MVVNNHKKKVGLPYLNDSRFIKKCYKIIVMFAFMATCFCTMRDIRKKEKYNEKKSEER